MRLAFLRELDGRPDTRSAPGSRAARIAELSKIREGEVVIL